VFYQKVISRLASSLIENKQRENWRAEGDQEGNRSTDAPLHLVIATSMHAIHDQTLLFRPVVLQLPDEANSTGYQHDRLRRYVDAEPDKHR
jgi:hypothetical protein